MAALIAVACTVLFALIVWIAYVRDDAGRLWSWAYGDSRKEARDGLILEGFAEHLEARGEREVTYELVVDPPRRTVVQ